MNADVCLRCVSPAAALVLTLCVGSAAGADYQSTILSQGPVGYWRLNENKPPPVQPLLATNLGNLGATGNGSLFADLLRGEPGALTGSADTSCRFFNPGWNVTYYGSRVDVANNAALNPNGPFTVEMWVKPSSAPGDLFAPISSLDASLNSNASREGYLVYLDGSTNATSGGFYSRWQFRVGGATGYSAQAIGGSFTVGAWHHVVGVYNGSSAFLYVNGVQAASNSVGSIPFVPNASQPLRIGASTIPNRGLDGWIDEVAFYNGTLSAATIRAHFDAATTNGANYAAQILTANPVGYWRLGEPGDPAASNLGTLGSAANGRYVYPAIPGTPGPITPSYSGLAATNQSCSFNGSGGYVSVPALNLNTNTLTITCWLSPTNPQAASAGIVLSRSSATVAGLSCDIISSLQLGYTWNNDPSTYNWASGLYMSDSDWSFVALVVQPAQAALFLANGANPLTFAGATNFVSHPNQLFDGQTLFGLDGGYTTRNFYGAIDEVAIFNRSLSAGEVYTEYAAALGNLAPVVFVDPQAPTNVVYEGDALDLAVDAGGTPALRSVWRKDGSPINGATTNTLHFLATNSGNYDVVITNNYGAATSQVAAITVIPVVQPTISQPPLGRILYTGGLLSLNVVASGGKLQYQWQKNGSNLSGATNTSYVVNGVTTTNTGQYQVIVTNPVGRATGGPVTVTVINPAANTYEGVVLGDGPEAWWRLDELSGTTMFDALGHHDGVYVGSPTFGSGGVIATGGNDPSVTFTSSSYGRVPYSAALNGTNYTLECWAKVADLADNYCPVSSISLGATTSPYMGRGYLLLLPAANNWWACFGLNDQYYINYVPIGTATAGQWAHLVMTYDRTVGQVYYLNGVRTPATGGYIDFVRNITSDFLIGAAEPGVAGFSFGFNGSVDEVAYYSRALTQTQIATHYQAALFGVNVAPVFTAQPKSQTVAAGATVSFNALANGTAPISMQWLYNGSAIAGQTASTLSMSNVYYTNAGNYQAQARNAYGTNLSTAASLSIMPPNPTFANLTNGLVLHLKFDGNYNDSSGHGNNAAPAGSNAVPTFVPGKLGSALRYTNATDTGVPIAVNPNGVVTNNSYATLGVRPDLQFSSNVNFTVAYWVRLPTNYLGGDLPLFCNDVGSLGNLGYTFAPGYTNGSWAYSLSGVQSGGGLINDGQWHSLVCSVDRTGNAVTYLDGMDVNETSAIGGGDLDTGKPTNIGQDSTGLYPEPGSAAIDDVGVWRRALTAYEAQAIYSVAQTYGKSFDTYGPVNLTIKRSGPDVELIWQAGTLLEGGSINGPWVAVPGAVAPYYKDSLSNGHLTITRVGSSLLLSWQSGALLQATNVRGPYTAVPGAAAPSYTFTPGSGSRFFRVVTGPVSKFYRVRL